MLKRHFVSRRSTRVRAPSWRNRFGGIATLYGISFNTVRRHRAWLDRPRELLVKLLWNRGPQPNLTKLSKYLKTFNSDGAHPRE